LKPFDKGVERTETFERSRIRDGLPLDDRQHALLAWYRRLIELRQTRPEFGSDGMMPYHHRVVLHDDRRVLVLQYWLEKVPTAVLILSFNQQAGEVSIETPQGSWGLSTASWNKEFGGNDQPAPGRIIVGAQRGGLWLPAYGAAFYTNASLPARPAVASHRLQKDN
jgi:hypothetical protein